MSGDHDLSGLYALDALDADDRVRYEAHLVVCHVCQTEVAGFREAITIIGDTPPPSLRARVLAGIEPVAASAEVIPITRRRSARATAPSRRLASMIAAAAMVAAVIGGLIATRDGSTPDEATLLADLRANGATSVSMSGTAGVDAQVVRAVSGDRAVIVLAGLAPLDDAFTYQAWTIDANERVRPAPRFRPDAAGRALVVLQSLPAELDTVAITIEPRGGSTLPTSPVVLVAKVV